jgi:hypothetical protein
MAVRCDEFLWWCRQVLRLIRRLAEGTVVAAVRIGALLPSAGEMMFDLSGKVRW